jgi:small subunit ribosomal protein S27Ae
VSSSLLFYSARFEQPEIIQTTNMQIFINSDAYTVEADASVESVKAMIENKTFVPAHLIRLVNGAEVLEGGSLAGNGVEDEDTLTMLLDVNGGMRKKWKKKRMRRLRRKRRKMRQRAR